MTALYLKILFFSFILILLTIVMTMTENTKRTPEHHLENGTFVNTNGTANNKKLKELKESFKTPEEKEQAKKRAQELRIDEIRKDIYWRRYGPYLWRIRYIEDGYEL